MISNQVMTSKSVESTLHEKLELELGQLVDPDSCFYKFHHVNIHYKICNAHQLNVVDHDQVAAAGKAMVMSTKQRAGSVKLGLPIIMLHGFGASLFSWNKVMNPLSHLFGCTTLAFDRPAFGLTSRVNYPSPPPLPAVIMPAAEDHDQDSAQKLDLVITNPYSTTFSSMTTVSFINDHLIHDSGGKAILIGHSAGAYVAMNAYFEAPEHVAALILVAPAIFPPLNISRKPKENSRRNGKPLDYNGDKTIFVFDMLLEYTTALVLSIMCSLIGIVMKWISDWIIALLCVILRSNFSIFLVRIMMEKFGLAILLNSWYDAGQMSEKVLKGYTKPMKVKGWERALVEYVISLLTENKLPGKQRSIVGKLSNISCPVLIITGDTDRLVPAWNARRLASAIPGSCFEVIKKCGHIPHEERVDEFLSVVESFLSRELGDLKKEH